PDLARAHPRHDREVVGHPERVVSHLDPFIGREVEGAGHAGAGRIRPGGVIGAAIARRRRAVARAGRAATIERAADCQRQAPGNQPATHRVRSYHALGARSQAPEVSRTTRAKVRVSSRTGTVAVYVSASTAMVSWAAPPRLGTAKMSAAP